MRVATLSRNARSCVMTIAAGPLSSRSSSSVMPSMSRWLVGSSSSSNCGSSASASDSAARLRSPPEAAPGATSSASPNRCRNSTSRVSARQRWRSSAICSKSTSQREALAQRRRLRQLGLLLDERNAEPVAAPDLAAVEALLARDDLQQARLAGAVAADQADALAGTHREPRAVEQRVQSIGEFGVEQRQQWHEAAEDRTGRAAASGRPRAKSRRTMARLCILRAG